MQLETSAKIHFVILSVAKDLVFPRIYEILRSLRFLRMTGEGTFAEVSTRYEIILGGLGTKTPPLNPGKYRVGLAHHA